MRMHTTLHSTRRPARFLGALLLVAILPAAFAAIDPAERAERWWDASRADRIGFSDRAAAACKTRNCDSLQIRSCLNDALKPPAAFEIRSKTIGEVAALCIARFSAKP